MDKLFFNLPLSSQTQVTGASGGLDLVRLELWPWPPASVSWSCWLVVRARQVWSVLSSVLFYGAYLALGLALTYGLRRLHVWRHERQVREHQDVFELVEQVQFFVL